MERQVVLTEKEYNEYEKVLKIFTDMFTLVNEPVYALDGCGTKMAYFNKIYMELNLEVRPRQSFYYKRNLRIL